MEPFTQPLAPSQHPYIIIHTEKKNLGAPIAAYSGGAFEISKYPVRIKYFLMLRWIFRLPCSGSLSCTSNSNKFHTCPCEWFNFAMILT